MQTNKGSAHSPAFIFTLYVGVGSLLILCFRLFFPGEAIPLPVFSRSWRLVKGLIDIIHYFPALAFSALVVHFGIPSEEDNYTAFSAELFHRLMAPVVTAICAAVLYGLLFFLILPIAQNGQENMRFRGELFKLAREQAQIKSEEGEWLEASQLIGICDVAWKDSPEIEDLRININIHLSEMQYAWGNQGGKPALAVASDLPGHREPVDAAEAIILGEDAFVKGKFMDAHWLATLGVRIAKDGSLEKAAASRLASRAWNEIENQQPGEWETAAFRLYRLKRSGYEAMVSGDWIRAFYIFRELINLTPKDPDAENFLADSEKETKKIAFFIDEMEYSSGEILTDAIFSLPWQPVGNTAQNGMNGRLVLRMSTLSFTPDYAYGTGIEYMVFDTSSPYGETRPLLSLQASHAKIQPITLEGRRKVFVLMRALDRDDHGKIREPQWQTASGIGEDSGLYQPGTAQFTLDISYETFLMLAQMCRQTLKGLPVMQTGSLFAAAKIAGGTGYIPQVYESEILGRLGKCLFFLPMSIIAIIIGWRFRSKNRPRYLFVPMLPVLPLVFNGLAQAYSSGISVIATTLVLAVGFSMALTIFIICLVVTFLLSLILLASQHG